MLEGEKRGKEKFIRKSLRDHAKFRDLQMLQGAGEQSVKVGDRMRDWAGLAGVQEENQAADSAWEQPWATPRRVAVSG